jgi:hypothetical protein
LVCQERSLIAEEVDAGAIDTDAVTQAMGGATP